MNHTERTRGGHLWNHVPLVRVERPIGDTGFSSVTFEYPTIEVVTEGIKKVVKSPTFDEVEICYLGIAVPQVGDDEVEEIDPEVQDYLDGHPTTPVYSVEELMEMGMGIL